MRPFKIVNTRVHNLYVREKQIELLVIIKVSFAIVPTISLLTPTFYDCTDILEQQGFLLAVNHYIFIFFFHIFLIY